MAKTYVNTSKYMVVETFEINGVVDKPDIIGAIFGQSEGLLGREMDLKELQNNGRIGRIDVKFESKEGKTFGEIYIPSSMDMVETSILAAAIETVDKIGPCEGNFKTKAITDLRADKRKEIEERAKELLKGMIHTQVPDTQELASKVRLDTRTAEIQGFGREKLPAGPELLLGNEIIVVEGRADVLTLLKNNIKNVIGMEGSRIPQEVIDLCLKKTVTAFVDGDRGGELNARKLIAMAKVDFVARAPDGKEVEELTQKELLQSLRHKVPASEFIKGRPAERQFSSFRQAPRQWPERQFGQRPFMQPREQAPFSAGMQQASQTPASQPTEAGTVQQARLMPQQQPAESVTVQPAFARPFEFRQPMQAPAVEGIDELKKALTELKGSFKARLLDEKNAKVKEVAVRELVNALEENTGAKKIAFDGIITQRIVDAAEKGKIAVVAGIKKGKIKQEKGIKLLVL